MYGFIYPGFLWATSGIVLPTRHQSGASATVRHPQKSRLPLHCLPYHRPAATEMTVVREGRFAFAVTGSEIDYDLVSWNRYTS